MSELRDFFDEVFAEFNKEITDKVFLKIQNDSVLMKKYLDMVEKKGRHTVNQKLGEAVKNEYDLPNTAKCEEPESTLIETYTEH